MIKRLLIVIVATVTTIFAPYYSAQFLWSPYLGSDFNIIQIWVIGWLAVVILIAACLGIGIIILIVAATAETSYRYIKTGEWDFDNNKLQL